MTRFTTDKVIAWVSSFLSFYLSLFPLPKKELCLHTCLFSTWVQTLTALKCFLSSSPCQLWVIFLLAIKVSWMISYIMCLFNYAVWVTWLYFVQNFHIWLHGITVFELSYKLQCLGFSNTCLKNDWHLQLDHIVLLYLHLRFMRWQ